MSEPASSGALALEQWIALNDEIAAMVRAGLPLEPCLMGVGYGRLAVVGRSIAGRLEQGAGLDEALSAESAHVPPIYEAVVRAGVRAGRLSSALEGLAVYARNFVELRRLLGLALIYPIMVVMLAYALFLGFLLYVLPPFLATFDAFRFSAQPALGLLEWLRRTAPYWAPVFPGLLVLAVLWWLWTGRARAFPRLGHSTPLGWIPGVRGLLRQVAAANFAELLALLVEHQTPLPEAVDLAARATGDRRLTRAALALADDLRQGQSMPRARDVPAGVPGLLRWLLAYGNRQGHLAPALRNAAEMYHRRARLRAELIRTFLPTVAMLLVGASVTALYALTLFVPFSVLLRQFAKDI
jgi:general secretion pathway protein F